MTDMRSLALRTAAVLWVIWGLVHVLAGFIVATSSPEGAVTAILDGVDAARLAADYPAELSGILSQHGWNLAWFGVVTIVGARFIWNGHRTAIWVTALVGGLADIGYFMFIDLAGHANFLPGALMTIVSASAIILSGWAGFGIAPRSDA